MLRLIPQRKYHVSNRTALLATLILVIASYINFNQVDALEPGVSDQAMLASSTPDTQVADNTANKRKLSVSLLLFGRG